MIPHFQGIQRGDPIKDTAKPGFVRIGDVVELQVAVIVVNEKAIFMEGDSGEAPTGRIQRTQAPGVVWIGNIENLQAGAAVGQIEGFSLEDEILAVGEGLFRPGELEGTELLGMAKILKIEDLPALADKGQIHMVVTDVYF